MGGVDLATFQFDPFLSWAVFFMNPDKTIYGRFGRAHPKTKRDKTDSNPNHTVAGLKAALTRALELHESYANDPKSVGPALAGKTGAEPRWRFAEKTPAARKYKRLRRLKSVAGEGEGCVHCHEVQRTAIDSYIMKRIDLPDSMLWMYPRPHVLGLTFDNTVLHNFPDDGGELPCAVRRGDKTIALSMELPPLWRRAEDWVWRYRVAGYSSWMWAGVSFSDHAGGVRVENRAPDWFKRTNRDGMQALERGDLIVSVDKITGMDRSALLAYLMRDKKLGSKVRMEVLRRGKSKQVSFKIPKEQPEVQGY